MNRKIIYSNCFWTLLIVSLGCSCGQKATQTELTSKNTNQIDPKSQDREMVLSEKSAFKYVCIASHKKGEKHDQNIDLLKKAIESGLYSDLFLELPAFNGLMIDRYIKGDEKVNIDVMCLGAAIPLSDALYISADDILVFLQWLKDHSDSSEHKLTVRGINFIELNPAVDTMDRIFSCSVMDSLKRIEWNHGTYTNIADVEKNTLALLLKEEKRMKKELGDAYPLFLRFFEIADKTTSADFIKNRKAIDKSLFDGFMFQLEYMPPTSRSILFLDASTLERGSGTQTFGRWIEKQFDKKELLIID